MSDERLVGREAELAALDLAADQLAEGDPARPLVLLLEGEPGIGKTALWQHALRRLRQRGVRLLVCRMGERESNLSFAGLTDLVGAVPDAVLGGLPAPQRRALDAALLRAAPDGAPPDPRAVNLATLTVVRLLAAAGPVVLAVDDAQWCDPATADALRFVVRRIGREPVGLLATMRTSGAGARPSPAWLDASVDADRVRRVALGPLSPAELYRLIRARTVLRPAKPDLLRLAGASAGNPLFALELARTVARAGWPDPTARLPVPTTVTGAVAATVAGMPEQSRETLLIAAALRHPTTAMIRAALELPGSVTPGLAAAEESGMVEVRDGRVGFTHPLYASAVYSSAATERRRAVHARLAGVVTDLDQRAWHLALAGDGPDAGVATVLAEAARQTQARGAPAMAAELWRLAVHRTTPGDPRASEWAVSGAECLFSAGDADGARDVLDRAVAELPAGHARARALLWLGSILFYQGSPRDAVAALRRAIPEAVGDPLLTGMLHLRVSWFADYDTDLRVNAARQSQRLLPASAGAELRACATIAGEYFGFLAGRGIDVGNLEAGWAMLPERDFSWEVEWARSMFHLWAKSFDIHRGRAGWLTKYERAYEIGDEPAVPHALLHLVEIECWLGNLDLAARYVAEMAVTNDQTGQRRWRGQTLYATALVAAIRWAPDDAVAAAREGLALAEELPDAVAAALHLSVLGYVELSRGAAEAADAYLTRAAHLVAEMGMREPARYTFFADQVEAALLLGDVERATGLTADLGERAARSPYPYLVGMAARSRALVALAVGDLDAAAAAAQAAVGACAAGPLALELARGQLVQGIVLRRRRERRAARQALTAAQVSFTRLGAVPWAARAAAELQALGLRPSSSTGLTPAEQRVADLVARGRTNDEVAAALFLSPRTVESHLHRIYPKLGVRSRTELARVVSGQP
ncbi:ATP-binding protein [Krasilnikovia sp. MM14-A1004]|uniref:ATP-binding protein n=1 Tax=Krasilnikovia sp. MM14-A1004 TaxID=3373541 RepID=UPI00399CA234